MLCLRFGACLRFIDACLPQVIGCFSTVDGCLSKVYVCLSKVNRFFSKNYRCLLIFMGTLQRFMDDCSRDKAD